MLQRTLVQGQGTRTGQRHHPHYEYSFGGAESVRYDFDKWFNKKGSAGVAWTPPVGYAPNLSAAAVDHAITTWNTARSIFVGLNQALIGATTWTLKAEPSAPQDAALVHEPTVQVGDAMGTSPAGQLFVQHVLTMEENVALRERDMPNSAPQTLTVVSQTKMNGPKSKEPSLTPNWPGLLQDARTALRAKLIAGEAAPAEKEDVELVDDAVMNSADPAFKALRDWELLTRNNDNKAKLKKSGPSGQGKGRRIYTVEFVPSNLLFNFGLNHLRTIIYVEWRAMTELLAAVTPGT